MSRTTMTAFDPLCDRLSAELDQLACDLGLPVDQPAARASPPAEIPGAARLRWLVAGTAAAGKTRLINALLGLPDFLPVRPHGGTTAVFRVHFGATRTVAGHRGPAAESPAATPLTEDEVAALAGGRAHAPIDLLRAIDHVAVTAPDDRLAAGLEVIDTPGVGGLNGLDAHPLWAWAPGATRVLWVTSAAGPPLGARDAHVLGRLAEAGHLPLLVHAQADLVGTEDRETLATRNREIIGRALGRPWQEIEAVSVSAKLKEELADPPGQPDAARRTWLARSGFPDLCRWLDADLAGLAPRRRTGIVAALRARATALRELAEHDAGQTTGGGGGRGAQVAEIDRHLAAFPEWRVQKRQQFEALWLDAFRALVNRADARLVAELDPRADGPLVGPILQDLRARELSPQQMEDDKEAIADRCQAACNEVLAAIANEFSARSQELTERAAAELGAVIDRDQRARFGDPSALAGGRPVDGAIAGASTPLPATLWSAVQRSVKATDTARWFLDGLAGAGLALTTGAGAGIGAAALIGFTAGLIGVRGKDRERALERVAELLATQVETTAEQVKRAFDRHARNAEADAQRTFDDYLDAIRHRLEHRRRGLADRAEPAPQAGPVPILDRIGRLEAALAEVPARAAVLEPAAGDS